MIGPFLPVDPILWHSGTHKKESDSVASINHNFLYETSCQRTNGAFLSIRASINSSTYSGTDGQWKEPKETWKKNRVKFKRKGKERTLQKILIVFHAVLAFPPEMSRYQRLSLLRRSAMWYRNQGAEEVQEHALPSAYRRTTVSLRPRTQIRRRKS